MENQARYVLVGLFTVAVIAAGFSFVYWLNTTGGLQQRAYYQIRYENSVSGLLVGSAVQFNGVRVGEVTALDLNAAAPGEIIATVAVDAGTPIRGDTKASIAFQGLMGAPAVSLTGGSPSAPITTLGPKGLPLLNADPAAGQTMTETAVGVLHRIDTVIAENAEPLRNTMANLSKFSDALGRNAEHVDGIVAGIERLTGGGTKPPAPAFDLTAPKSFPKFEKPSLTLLVIPYPSAPQSLGQDKILVREGEGVRPISPDAKWSDMLLDQFQSRIIQSFENAGFLQQVSRPIEGATSDFQLMTDLRRFEIVAGAPTASAEVEFSAKLVNNDGQIVGAKVFHASVPVSAIEAPAAAAALNAAFATTATDLVVWTSSTIRGKTATR
jgi:phospholipid/cholesterol/gamma-HCH transport system substrate-binding protein